ncbi:MAG TPA: NAD(P)-binding domain-containing protein, partial [Candidatus Saccharimonadales bacterium]|nr:NAD(P)-binding domain-containing protein [Candidatus Saccharimonadales bacterium]
MPKQPALTIIGCGYVGLTTAAVLANCGVQVRAIEVNPERLATIKAGHSFFYETGIDALLASAIKSGALTVTNSYKEAVPGSSIVFSCVGTPDNPDGSSNLEYVHEAAARAAEHMQPGTIFAQKSTVPVGTGKELEAKLKG